MELGFDPQELLRTLVAFDSVSSRSNVDITCFVAEQLEKLGFQVERCDYFDADGIAKANLIATRMPPVAVPAVLDEPSPAGNGVAYFAHTDVVPVDGWDGPGGPFDPAMADDRIYGRGSCDMKGSLVAMITAAARLDPLRQTAPITIVCTADEEVGFLGARHLVNESPSYRQLVRRQPLAIIGEPTRCEVVHAHKGIEAFQITSLGRAAHSSSREGKNANLAMVPMLDELLRLYEQTESDPRLQDARFDPPTLSWTFGVSDHCEAVNITPARSDAWVSFRPMPDIDAADLVIEMRRAAERLGLSFSRHHGGPPLWADPQDEAIRQMCRLAGVASAKTVCYATDGGELSELQHRVVCGPGDIAQAHTSDEWISLDQLNRGIDLYHRVLTHWCVAGDAE